MSNITTKFKGHESFVLRKGWIYKGIKAIYENNKNMKISNMDTLFDKSPFKICFFQKMPTSSLV
jgi:hypothetical protein